MALPSLTGNSVLNSLWWTGVPACCLHTTTQGEEEPVCVRSAGTRQQSTPHSAPLCLTLDSTVSETRVFVTQVSQMGNEDSKATKLCSK